MALHASLYSQLALFEVRSICLATFQGQLMRTAPSKRRASGKPVMCRCSNSTGQPWQTCSTHGWFPNWQQLCQLTQANYLMNAGLMCRSRECHSVQSDKSIKELPPGHQCESMDVWLHVQRYVQLSRHVNLQIT